ncbi:hypothetical protein UlMin_009851 [Ulmus minor]
MKKEDLNLDLTLSLGPSNTTPSPPPPQPSIPPLLHGIERFPYFYISQDQQPPLVYYSTPQEEYWRFAATSISDRAPEPANYNSEQQDCRQSAVTLPVRGALQQQANQNPQQEDRPLAAQSVPPQPANQNPQQKDRRLAESKPVKAPRRQSRPILRKEQSQTISPSFAWATDQRAVVQSLESLVSKGITKITGKVKCRRCDKQYEMSYDLATEFKKIWNIFARGKSNMHERAPKMWMNPDLPKCEHCEQKNAARPIIANKKREINWLFLLLGQLLGCCTLNQLKYFCKHSGNHRTAAKDRLLFLTYLGLCKQLDSNGPFDRD